MADMYKNLDSLLDDDEVAEEAPPEKVDVWVVRRKGADGKFVTKYESTTVERALEFFSAELRFELMSDPTLKTDIIGRTINQYRHDFPGYDREAIDGVTHSRDKAHWLKYLSGDGYRRDGWRQVQVSRPAIKHNCAHGVVWRVYRSQQTSVPEHESFDRRAAALLKLNKILGDKG
jgi:hypothetical protein